MNRTSKIIGLLALTCSVKVEAAPWADTVMQYTPGTIRSDYQVGTASLGKTASSTGVVVTPFNAPFSPNELTGIGPGGNLVLHLGQTAATGQGYTLGVHSGVNLLNVGGASGQAANPASTFSARRADISVAYEFGTWIPLQSDVVFDVPTNWYSEGVSAPASQTTAGTKDADFTKPFVGSLSSFNNLTYAQMLTLLDGSAGGKWFDLTNVNLPGVNYVQFSVDAQDVQMYVDMVVAVPEPATMTTILLASMAAGLSRRRSAGKRE
jgi:hypothetical protein